MQGSEVRGASRAGDMLRHWSCRAVHAGLLTQPHVGPHCSLPLWLLRSQLLPQLRGRHQLLFQQRLQREILTGIAKTRLSGKMKKAAVSRASVSEVLWPWVRPQTRGLYPLSRWDLRGGRVMVNYPVLR